MQSSVLSSYGNNLIHIQGGNFTASNRATIVLSPLSDIFGVRVGSLNSSLAPDVTVDSGTVLFENSGALGIGPKIVGTELFASTVTLNNGSMTFFNSGNISNSSSNIGVNVESDSFIMNNGSLVFENRGNCSQRGIGTHMQIQDIVINEGAVTLTNQGAVSTAGVGVSLAANNVTINGGSVSLTNQGAISNQGLGVGLYGGNITINGGVVTNSNFGSVDASSSTSSSIIFGQNKIVQNGGMFINDSLVATPIFMIGSAATYAGIGTTGISITPVEMTNGGTVVPGDPGPGGLPGIMTITGSYTQTSSGTLVINIENQSSYSQLLINGSANLSGTLEVAGSPGASISSTDRYIVVNTTDGITGTFTNLLNFNLFLMPQITYLPTSVELSFLATIPKYVNLIQPQFSSLNETHTRLTKSMEKLRTHFTKPVKKTGTKVTKSFNHSDEASIQFVAYSDDFVETEEKRERLTQALGDERPWNFYVGPKGQVGNVYSNEDAQGYRNWSTGAYTGFDYAFSQVGIGLLAEYERFKANVGKNWGDFIINTAHADIYATYAPSQLPEFSLNGIVGGGYQWYDIDRNVLQGTTDASPRGAGFDSLFGVEYAFKNSVFEEIPENLYITPMASVQYMYLHIQDYTEKGVPLQNMKVSRQNQKSLRSNLGFRIGHTWEIPNVKFSPEFTCSWQREFLDKKRSVRFTQTTGPSVPVILEIGKSGRNIVLTGVDLMVTLYDRHGLEAGYDFEYNSAYHTHFMYMSYNVRF